MGKEAAEIGEDRVPGGGRGLRNPGEEASSVGWALAILPRGRAEEGSDFTKPGPEPRPASGTQT